MPSTTREDTMNGTKRKIAPVKDAYKTETKKPKFGSRPNSALKSKVKSVPAKTVEELSDSGDSESDGGVPLYSQPEYGEDSRDAVESDATEDSDTEPLPKIQDGLHPERAKAVVVNSEGPLQAKHYIN
jgi:pumilio family protein 6